MMMRSLYRLSIPLMVLISIHVGNADTNTVGVATNSASALIYPANLDVTTSASSTLPDPSVSLLRVFGAFALVIGVFLAGVWGFRNWQRVMLRGGKSPRLTVLEVKSLGGRHALYLVGCDEQRLLLAASPTGVKLLSHMPDGNVPALEQPEVTSFPESLDRAIEPGQ